PPDPRYALRAHTHRLARKKREPVDAAVLLRPLDRELEAEADAEHRPVQRKPLAQHRVEPLRVQLRHRRPCRPDPGKHREIGARHVVRQLCAESAQRDLDRADVARAVITDRDLHRIPFVEGMPADSVRNAVRSARPTALYAASAVWWGSRPVAWTWIAIRPACASEAKKCCAIPGSVSNA